MVGGSKNDIEWGKGISRGASQCGLRDASIKPRDTPLEICPPMQTILPLALASDSRQSLH